MIGKANVCVFMLVGGERHIGRYIFMTRYLENMYLTQYFAVVSFRVVSEKRFPIISQCTRYVSYGMFELVIQVAKLI